jgi:hypothetical protein
MGALPSQSHSHAEASYLRHPVPVPHPSPLPLRSSFSLILSCLLSSRPLYFPPLSHHLLSFSCFLLLLPSSRFLLISIYPILPILSSPLAFPHQISYSRHLLPPLISSSTSLLYSHHLLSFFLFRPPPRFLLSSPYILFFPSSRIL